MTNKAQHKLLRWGQRHNIYHNKQTNTEEPTKTLERRKTRWTNGPTNMTHTHKQRLTALNTAMNTTLQLHRHNLFWFLGDEPLHLLQKPGDDNTITQQEAQVTTMKPTNTENRDQPPEHTRINVSFVLFCEGKYTPHISPALSWTITQNTLSQMRRKKKIKKKPIIKIKQCGWNTEHSKPDNERWIHHDLFWTQTWKYIRKQLGYQVTSSYRTITKKCAHLRDFSKFHVFLWAN